MELGRYWGPNEEHAHFIGLRSSPRFVRGSLACYHGALVVLSVEPRPDVLQIRMHVERGMMFRGKAELFV